MNIKMFLKNFVYIFYAIAVVNPEPFSQSPDNYGPYSVLFHNYTTCKGPKSKDVAMLTVSMNNNSTGAASMTFTFYSDTSFDEVKVQVFSIKGDKKNYLWNYKLHNPCKHLIFATIIKLGPQTTDSCVIKKGYHHFHVNYTNIMRSFMGESFYYETIVYKTIMISKKGNIGCTNMVVTFQKK